MSISSIEKSIAHYKMDSVLSTGLIKNEMSPSGMYNALPINGDIIVGYHHNCIKLSGYTSYINTNYSLDISSSFSIIGWMRFGDISVENVIFGSFNQTDISSRFYVEVSITDIKIYIGNNIVTYSHQTTYNNVWHQFAITYNQANHTVKLYIDRVIKISVQVEHTDMTPSNLPLFIGSINRNSAPYKSSFVYVEDLLLYNQALLDSDISELYLYDYGASGIFITPITGIDGDSGTVSVDMRVDIQNPNELYQMIHAEVNLLDVVKVHGVNFRLKDILTNQYVEHGWITERGDIQRFENSSLRVYNTTIGGYKDGLLYNSIEKGLPVWAMLSLPVSISPSGTRSYIVEKTPNTDYSRVGQSLLPFYEDFYENDNSIYGKKLKSALWSYDDGLSYRLSNSSMYPTGSWYDSGACSKIKIDPRTGWVVNFILKDNSTTVTKPWVGFAENSSNSGYGSSRCIGIVCEGGRVSKFKMGSSEYSLLPDSTPPLGETNKIKFQVCRLNASSYSVNASINNNEAILESSYATYEYPLSSMGIAFGISSSPSLTDDPIIDLIYLTKSGILKPITTITSTVKNVMTYPTNAQNIVSFDKINLEEIHTLNNISLTYNENVENNAIRMAISFDNKQTWCAYDAASTPKWKVIDPRKLIVTNSSGDILYSDSEGMHPVTLKYLTSDDFTEAFTTYGKHSIYFLISFFGKSKIVEISRNAIFKSDSWLFDDTKVRIDDSGISLKRTHQISINNSFGSELESYQFLVNASEAINDFGEYINVIDESGNSIPFTFEYENEECYASDALSPLIDNAINSKTGNIWIKANVGAGDIASFSIVYSPTLKATNASDIFPLFDTLSNKSLWTYDNSSISIDTTETQGIDILNSKGLYREVPFNLLSGYIVEFRVSAKNMNSSNYTSEYEILASVSSTPQYTKTNSNASCVAGLLLDSSISSQPKMYIGDGSGGFNIKNGQSTNVGHAPDVSKTYGIGMRNTAVGFYTGGWNNTNTYFSNTINWNTTDIRYVQLGRGFDTDTVSINPMQYEWIRIRKWNENFNTTITSSSSYPTSGQVVTTTDEGRFSFNSTIFKDVISMNMWYNIPTNTSIKMLFSTDGRQTWNKWNTGTSTFTQCNINIIGTSGNSPSDLSGVSNISWKQLVESSPSYTMDIAIYINTASISKTPNISKISYTTQYNTVPFMPSLYKILVYALFYDMGRIPMNKITFSPMYNTHQVINTNIDGVVVPTVESL